MEIRERLYIILMVGAKAGSRLEIYDAKRGEAHFASAF